MNLLYEATINEQTKQINFVNFRDFIDICQDTIMVEEKTDSRKVKELLVNATEVESVEFRSYAREIVGKINEKYKNLQRAFRNFDQEKSSYVTFSEFIEGLVQLNVNLNEKQIRSVFEVLDQESKGHLNFEDFCRL